MKVWFSVYMTKEKWQLRFWQIPVGGEIAMAQIRESPFDTIDAALLPVYLPSATVSKPGLGSFQPSGNSVWLSFFVRDSLQVGGSVKAWRSQIQHHLTLSKSNATYL